MSVCIYACMYVCSYVRMYVCMHVCMYTIKNVRMHVRMHACMHACMYVRMSCLSTYFRWPGNTTLKSRTIYFRWPRNTTLKSQKRIFEPQDNSFDAVFGSLCLCAARLPGRFGPIQLSHHEPDFCINIWCSLLSQESVPMGCFGGLSTSEP